jgi:hypothetical protein
MHFDETTTLTAMEKSIIIEIQRKELWGDITFGENEYCMLRDRLKAVISNGGIDIMKLSKQFPCVITTFFVFMSRYKYDTNFWNLAEKELEISINGIVQSEIGKVVRDTFNRYKFDIADVKEEKRINIEPILYEAGLPPESGLDDLFYVLKFDRHFVFDPRIIIEDLIGMRSYQVRKPLLKFLKRFQDNRAVEYIIEVHDSMIAVDQGRASDSRYVGRYIEWKNNEGTKERQTCRKNKEFQPKPYLMFENGKRGLCMSLPRIILNKEWLEDIEWIITYDDGKSVMHHMSVFGDEGRRYIQSIVVPISPSAKYVVSLIDNETLEREDICKWELEGIRGNNVIFFNANGRMTSPNYLLLPYFIAIMSNEVEICKTNQVSIACQAYPTDSEKYKVITIQANGRDAEFEYCGNGSVKSLKIRPQINLSLEGSTLFSVTNEKNNLYTEIPSLIIKIDEGLDARGLNLRIEKERVSIDDMFNEAVAKLDLKDFFETQLKQYGTYSIRLYQDDYFIRQIEFNYVPKIKSNYIPIIRWPDRMIRKENKFFKFEKLEDWEIEIDDCIVNLDEENYTVEVPASKCVINGKICSVEDNNDFCCGFELPVNPLSIELIDSAGEVIESVTDSIKKLGLSDIDNKEYWVCIESYGEYKNYEYQLIVRNSNGIEQKEKLNLSQNGNCNINLSCFYDTLRSCPLPAQIEVCCNNVDDMFLPILLIADTLELSERPKLNRKPEIDYIVVSLEDAKKDLVIKKYGIDRFEITLPLKKAKLSKNGNKKGFIISEHLQDGIYTVENRTENLDFLFEDETDINITNGNNMLYVSSHEKGMPITTFKEWLDQLIRDILDSGVNNNIINGKAWAKIGELENYKNEEIAIEDCEKLILISEFINAKCIGDKKESMRECMRQISYHVLNGKMRLEILRVLAELNRNQEIIDICIQEYNLFLFEVGSDDAIELAGKLENYSVEIALLLLMGVDAPIRDTIGKENFRELVGRDAIRSLIKVPNVDDAEKIKTEQKKFLREERPCAVRINLTNEISGDMESIQGMIEITHNNIRLNLSKKPDSGIYFAHIRYVDQYVNWITSTHDKELNMEPKKKKIMIQVVKDYCKEIIDCLNQMKGVPRIGNVLKKYDEALMARTTNDILSNLNSNDNGRYFYLQGIAAFFASLPKEYKNYGDIVRVGEKFMSYAMVIAPRISKRDLIMASTYIYLTRKEEKLCQ